MDRSVQDHEVTMLAALHSFITNGDARSEKVVDWYMQAQLAIDSQQVADFLSGLGEKEPAERVLMAMSVMYGYTTLSCLEVAKDMFEELVEMDPRGTAHSYLAAFYMTPWINEVDKKRAVAIYREGVKRGSAACMSSLGLLLEKSTDEYRNVEEALALYRRAASLGCAHGINNWAVHLLNKNNQCPQGLTLLKQAADLGEADACYSYSQLMQWSDRRQAVRYMQRAVNSGMVGMQEEAQKALSNMLCNDHASFVPYGEWRNTADVHRHVSPPIGAEMRAVLLMKSRRDAPFGELPKDLVLDICFWLCTLPRPELSEENNKTLA